MNTSAVTGAGIVGEAQGFEICLDWVCIAGIFGNIFCWMKNKLYSYKTRTKNYFKRSHEKY